MVDANFFGAAVRSFDADAACPDMDETSRRLPPPPSPPPPTGATVVRGGGVGAGVIDTDVVDEGHRTRLDIEPANDRAFVLRPTVADLSAGLKTPTTPPPLLPPEWPITDE